MVTVSIPGRGRLALVHLVLDVNGTLALDGALLPGVAERIEALKGSLTVHLLTADTHGRLEEVAGRLGVRGTRLPADVDQVAAKARYVEALGPNRVVAVGNGANDAGMLRAAALGIAVLGPEGLARAAWEAADLVAPDIPSALDLLLNPRRLTATLRTR